MDEGQFAAAEKIDREVVGMISKILGPDHPDSFTDSIHLAAILEKEGRSPEAEQTDREALEPARRALGARSLPVQLAMNTLALALAHEGHYAEAEDEAKRALDVESHLQMPEHVNNNYSTYYLACIAAIRGQRGEALSLLEKSIDRGLWPEASLTMALDPDLKSLHGDPRFDALVAHAKERASESQKSN